MDTVHVVLCADDAYVLPAAVAIRSLTQAFAPGRPLNIYVVDGGLKPESKPILVEASSGRVKFVTPAETSVGSGRGYISAATLLRLQIPNLLPDLSRVLYIDCDVLVLDDIGKLWDQTAVMKGPLAAVADLLLPLGHVGMTKSGFRAGSRYFNAGVLSMNLEELRGAFDGVDVCARAASMFLLDQDFLNLIFERRWDPLPPRWNAQTDVGHFAIENAFGTESSPWRTGNIFSDSEVSDMLERPGILHYAHPSKPWHLHVRHPKAEIWRERAAADFGDRFRTFCEMQTNGALFGLFRLLLGDAVDEGKIRRIVSDTAHILNNR